MTLANACGMGKTEDVVTVELVCNGSLFTMAGESFPLPVWFGNLLEVGSLEKGSWICGWSGQLPDGQETSMGAEWAVSHS